MPSERRSAGDVLSRLARLLGLGEAEARAGDFLGALHRQTRAQLLEWSGRLGLPDPSELSTDALMRRVRQALEALGVGGQRLHPEPEARGDVPPAADLAHRFDLGRPAESTRAPEHIPWSYGQDRITAVAIDPDRLFVYWEVTDEAIARARVGLGAGGPEAWLDLRIYDVTGRLFDGTNAHGYTDHKVERTDRQWFLDLHKPASTAVVEIGLKSFEGYFVRIVRSGRVDFPRREPAPPGRVEWLTVRAATGEVAPPVPAAEAVVHAGAPATPTPAPDVAWPAADWPTPADAVLEEGLVPGEAFVEQSQWERTFHTEWEGGERTLVRGSPVVRTTWEAGPFETAIESPVFVEERHEGATRVQIQNGRTRIVYGPWQVVIRGLGARAERQVVATWEVQRSWVTSEGAKHVGPDGPGGIAPVAGGGSEQRVGASWPGASSVRFGGASEVWRLGASERRFEGASERAYGGGSEPRLAGDDAPLPYPTRKA